MAAVVTGGGSGLGAATARALAAAGAKVAVVDLNELLTSNLPKGYRAGTGASSEGRVGGRRLPVAATTGIIPARPPDGPI
jgi:NAD(P)-dependent dehydrogenase (short-subunit alcohol dehydrogenase family)